MDTALKNAVLTPFNILYKISPKTVLKILFLLKTKRRLNLSNPKGFNEKLNWLKLCETDKANKLKPLLSDKYMARKYVEEKGCSEILNRLYWEGYNPDSIPFDELPSQFVIKVTHGSTFNIIVKDKTKLNYKKTTKQLRKWLKADFIPCYGEWWYGKVKPRIIIEEYLENSDKGDLIDYKVFCFNGEPKLVDVHTGRFDSHRRNVYDTSWNFLDFVNIRFAHAGHIDRPAKLDELLRYASFLSKDFAHVRMDFFIVGDKIIFTEFTFCNGSGFSPITPHSFDLQMGEWLKLPKIEGSSR